MLVSSHKETMSLYPTGFAYILNKQLSKGRVGVLRNFVPSGGLGVEVPRGNGLYPELAALPVVLLHLVSIKDSCSAILFSFVFFLTSLRTHFIYSFVTKASETKVKMELWQIYK